MDINGEVTRQQKLSHTNTKKIAEVIKDYDTEGWKTIQKKRKLLNHQETVIEKANN